MGVLLNKVLNKEVIFDARFILPDILSNEPCALVDHLHEQYQLPSVRHLQFSVNAKVANIETYITFLQLFPKLDTLVNPPMECFKDAQICKFLRRQTLLCLRKLVLYQTPASCINDISRCFLRWKNLDLL